MLVGGVIAVGLLATTLGTSATLWLAAAAVSVAGVLTLIAQDVRAVGADTGAPRRGAPVLDAAS